MIYFAMVFFFLETFLLLEIEPWKVKWGFGEKSPLFYLRVLDCLLLVKNIH
jgi:hypothetical protein